MLLVLITVMGLLWAMPGAVACAFIDQTSLTRWDDRKFSENPDRVAHDRYDALLRQARSRIESTFGESTSTPHIVFFDSVQPIPFYKPNQYASTQFFGSKACIFIGPKGQNVDVVSHELVHTDIFTILGPLDRTLHMPAWLDEGLAMQVDYRPRYDLEQPGIDDLLTVGSWNSFREFFDVAQEDELANRYALAKAQMQFIQNCSLWFLEV